MYELLGALFDKADENNVAPVSYLLGGQLLPALRHEEARVSLRARAPKFTV